MCIDFRGLNEQTFKNAGICRHACKAKTSLGICGVHKGWVWGQGESHLQTIKMCVGGKGGGGGGVVGVLEAYLQTWH